MKKTTAALLVDDQLEDQIYEQTENIAAILYALSSLFGSDDLCQDMKVEVPKVRPLLSMASCSMTQLSTVLDKRLARDGHKKDELPPRGSLTVFP